MSVFLVAPVQGRGVWGGVMTSMPMQLTSSVSLFAPCTGGHGPDGGDDDVHANAAHM